jgi:putative PIN family toxin of toxin-antitoxin system
MRVVLDTNILVRAAKPTFGPAAEVVRRLKSGPHTLIASPYLLAELERVLLYPRVQALHGMSAVAVRQFVDDYNAVVELVHLPSTPSDALTRDPDDDAVVRTAVVGRADVLCTGDNDLLTERMLAYAGASGFTIVTDVALLTMLRSQAP